MKFSPTDLPDVVLVEPEPRRDDRGFLARTYCEKEFAAQGLNTRWVQQNHTMTRTKGSVRGLHYQAAPSPEIKLVRCLAGRVLDVAVDVRPGSPTFGRWTSCELSAANMRALYIPAGFAHGFQCLEDDCELFYLMSDFYDPALARGLRWNDPTVGVAWPLPVVGLSERDQELPFLDKLEP
ncbi:dTDP-4-dehydrorhamnose 3,5-epimerase [Verrucomicrobiaceae bacterium SCGC AG-212-N21]|nr:dTDP-4-dehydrorhamnose 3,5-epimerase [Verrucomicrobiaceae bacterium SCGC AG-212-N21]